MLTMISNVANCYSDSVESDLSQLKDEQSRTGAVLSNQQAELNAAEAEVDGLRRAGDALEKDRKALSDAVGACICLVECDTDWW